MELSINETRQIALFTQLYQQHQLTGKTGVFELIRQLAYVQIDTISVVERAHHHTIWSRINSYEKSHLDDLLAKDRLIFEHWGHAASYLPMEDYRYSLPRMQRFQDESGWEKQFCAANKQLMQDVLDRITAEGALGARDFADTRIEKAEVGWGTGKPEKIALELLTWSGELMVSRRDKFQRIYDLRERVLPAWVDTSVPTFEELHRHYIYRSLAAMGIGTEAEIRAHFMLKKSSAFSSTLQEMLEGGDLQKVKVIGREEAYYMLSEGIAILDNLPQHSEAAYLLSPFDNAIINRSRIKALFGFDYTLECYVTPKKRVYGYWCLPILYEGKFVGRLDCKANRAAKKMEVINLHWEAGYNQQGKITEAVQETFDRFALFCGCESKPIRVS